jgi:hypothetical protein
MSDHDNDPGAKTRRPHLDATYVCSLCGKTATGFGNNPEPLGDFDSRCCDDCNRSRVIPARLGAMQPNYEVRYLRGLIRQAVTELDAVHRPMWLTERAEAEGRPPLGCEMCYPGDGSWPCNSAMVANDLREVMP